MLIVPNASVLSAGMKDVVRLPGELRYEIRAAKVEPLMVVDRRVSNKNRNVRLMSSSS